MEALINHLILSANFMFYILQVSCLIKSLSPITSLGSLHFYHFYEFILPANSLSYKVLIFMHLNIQELTPCE
jgi:hypothetical protein